MASIRKSFNFRNGVQVDNDNFIINPNGLVGIGTSVPTEVLDVYGNVKVSDTLTSKDLNSTNLNISGITTLTEVRIGSGITISSSSGIITASAFYGDGATLSNIVGYSTEAWIVNIEKTGVSTSLSVGIGTTANSLFSLLIGGNPAAPGTNGISFVGSSGNIRTSGNILSSGTITAGNFSGIITATDLTGTINNDRFPSNLNISGIITAGNYFSGSLVGVASTANDITPTSTVSITGLNVGVSTVTSLLNVQGSVGIGTTITNADLHIRRSGISSLRLTSDGNFPSRIILGRNSISNSGNGEIRFGDNQGDSYSTQSSLDIINYDTGNLNYYANYFGGSGSHHWFNGNIIHMTLTSLGRLGIGVTNPTETFAVVGTSTVTSTSYVGGDFSVVGNIVSGGSLTVGAISATGQTIIQNLVGISTNNPQYSLQIGRSPLVTNGGVGISSDGFVRIRNDIPTVRHINSSGIVTSTGLDINGNADISGTLTADTINFTTLGAGDGSQLTNINAANITGTLNTSVLPSNVVFTGIVTANRFSGNGSTLTTLNASSLSSGTIPEARLQSNYNISGIVTANALSTGTGNLEITISGNQLTFSNAANGQSVTLTLA
jgi:hypothetical protein